MDDSLSIINPFPGLLKGPSLLHQLIRGPEHDGIALEYTNAECKHTSLSYSDLHGRAEKLAARLLHQVQQTSGTRPGIIPLYISQCPSLYISILAVLKAGAAFCPLNLDVPEDRLKFILQDTSAQVILTTTELQSRLPELQGVSIVDVDEVYHPADSRFHGEYPSDITLPPTSSSSLAYIMYTSGSTGLPKAVCLPHQAVTQSLLAHDKHIPRFSRFLQFASPTFDVSVFEIFFPWIRGCTLVSCDRGRLLSDLPGTMTSLNIDAAELTPSVAASLVRKRENVPTLKTLLTIGEMLNVQVIQEFGGSETQSSMLYGMYGPTEAAIHCTLQPSFAADMAAGTIGIPLDTVSCFIIRPASSVETAGDIEILPLGEVGELAVGGHQLALGYLNREEQTRAAFVSHPKFGSLYRTGDKARMLSNGILECQGRISSGQVKLRGQRIELGEIEHAASKVTGCHAVVASVIAGQLVAFCIVEQANVTADAIRQGCRKWLSSYMVPSEVVLLDDFPYLPSGKVDKRKLESDYKSRASQSELSGSDTPESLQTIAQVISRVLQTHVNGSTNLNSVGLDSLKAIHIASELRKEGIGHIGALDLLAAHSLKDLEATTKTEKSAISEFANAAITRKRLLDKLWASVVDDAEIANYAMNLQQVLPCTPLQDALLSETARNPQAYCNSFKLSLPPDTSISKIRQCLHELAGKHSMLRSGFCVSRTSTSSYLQLTWESFHDTQFSEVSAHDPSFVIREPTNLLRPLRIQCMHDSEQVDLLVQLHHALYDQWSIEILIEDMGTILRGAEIPARPAFQAVNEHFLDLKLSPDSQSGSLEFWQEYLSAASPGTLPRLNCETLPAATLATAEHTIHFDPSALRTSARHSNCSPHVIFQAAYAYLLSIYIGTTDVTFGTVYSGRTMPIAEIESIFGPILSTLPTWIDFSEARKFNDVLRRLQEDNRNIMQHSSVSLADIRKASSISSGQALFDSIFVWQETARQPADGHNIVRLHDAQDYLEFNLTLELEPFENGVRAKSTYQPSLLAPEVVRTMMCQLEQIARVVIENPDVLMNDLMLPLSPSLLSISNPEPQNFVFKQNLGSVVEVQARETPERVALQFAYDLEGDHVTTESLTYEELNTKANRLANFLISAGTLPDDLICICMEKSIDLYVGILAIVKSGAGYLPIVPETPPARITQILSDAKIKICLTDTGMSSIIADMELCQVINIISTDYSGSSHSNPQVPFDPSNIAYAVFTSGTTGKPKGVLVTQENILSNLAVLEKIYPVPDGSKMLQACNQAFDVSVFEIFFTWFTGMCLCSATKDVLFRDLENVINQLDITHLSLTPTVAALVDPINTPKVQFLVTAGEAVTHQVHKIWAGKGLYQGYGPSETTNICTVNPAVLPTHAINNIGPAFENTSAFVLSSGDDFQPLPSGAIGELCFGGQQVFRGYQDMEDVTASKIIDHPEYGRVYRSGDLGRMLPNGTILIQGRKDDQRKLRGLRIELGEISGLLLRLPSVHDCSVQILGDTKQQERLVAFWVPKELLQHDYSVIKPNDNIKERNNALFVALADELPQYMIPALLVPLTAFPRTSQGKIDRRRLATDVSRLGSEEIARFSQILEESADLEAPSDTERSLMDALAEVLQLPQSSISRTISFFALGLDSVSAIRFSRTIKLTLVIQIDVSVILKRSSIVRLAKTIDERLSSYNEVVTQSSEPSIDDMFTEGLGLGIMNDFEAHGRKVQVLLPCTPLQEAMLSASSVDHAAAYYNRTVFKVTGDLTLLKQCWLTMLERHEILRTAFVATDETRFPYLQAVLSKVDLPWSESVIEHNNPDTLLVSDVNDKTVPVIGFIPPYQLKVFTSAESTYLLLEMHHAMYDGNAMSNLLHEVEEVYKGISLPSASKFAPFLKHLAAMDFDAADSFFDSHLAGYIPKPFNKISTGTTRQGFGVVETRLSVSQVKVTEFLRRHTVSMIGLVQATWARVLSLSQAHSDICFGNVVSGRMAPVDGVQSLVAPCFNTIPVRVDVARVRSNLELVKVLQQANLDSLLYQLVPLRRLQANAPVKATRLFDSMVLLQQESTTLDDTIWKLHGEVGEMNFPCILEITPIQDEFHLALHFDRNYFDGDDVPGMLSSAFLAAFSSCVTYPSGDISDLVSFDRQKVEGTLKPNEQIMSDLQAALHQKGSDGQLESKEQWSSIELKIRQAFAAVSGTPAERISRDTTIYRIGLDSISAIQVAGRLRKQGIPLTAGDVMESPSCSLLASVVHSQNSTPIKNSPAFDLEAFDQRHRGSILQSLGLKDYNLAVIRPCTAVQAGMLSQYLHSDGEQYLNHVFYQVDANLDLSQLTAAWDLVVEKHEMLRTGFASTENGLHPFAMLTYSSLESSSTRLESFAHEERQLTFAERRKAAINKIQKNVQLPPWRWDLFGHGDKNCLQFSAHHAIFDAETLRLIQADLHQALTHNVVSHRETIDSALSLIISSSLDKKEAQQMFWSKQLKSFSTTRFPNLHPVRVSEVESVVLNHICKLPRSEIEAKCRELNVSVQAAGQSAWSRLLAAYTGESYVTFGVVSSGRTTAETISCAFPCITTLPVVANASQSDEKLLQDLMAYNAAIQKFQFTPLTDIQRYAGSPNEALFDTLFAYQKPISENAEDPVWRIIHENASVDYAISIEMESLPQDQLGFRLTAPPQQIPEHQGRLILQQLEALLYKIIGASSTIAHENLSIVPAKETVLPTNIKYLHEFVADSVSKHPDRVALEFVSDIMDGQVTSRKWTYRRLDQESDRIAQLLLDNGCRANEVIATSFDKCPEASFAFLGILKAGCAFCAIDPTAPTARKAFILEDSHSSLILTTSKIVSELKGLTKCKAVDIIDSSVLETMPFQPIPKPQISPSSISYVLYTSGTTGTPKGCELTHDNAVQALLAFQRLFEGRWDENSHWLQFASYHFDVAVLEQFWTWSVGICMVSAPRDLILEDIAGFIDTLQITHLDLTPSLGRLLDPTTVPSLHKGVFITGGEALKQDMINSWGDVGCLYNFYGPTECTIGVTTFPSVPRQGKPSNIGWLFDNVGAFVLAPGTQEPVLRGAVGELCISGRLVGKGYLNRPELTDDRFPSLAAFDERVYRTGDLVRLLHDESIDFLGRQDNQVKLRGQRLEIDEIEAVIRECPEIQDVVCLVAKHSKQQKDLLVGFIAISPKRSQGDPLPYPAESAHELIKLARTACEDRLPGYMVPTHFIAIDMIPLSVNNKVEEKKLRALYNSLPTSTIQEYASQSEDQQPLTDRERSIACVLAALLQIDADDLKASSNIFALGLSSISAIQFSRKLKSEGFANAQVALVMKCATISKLAIALSSAPKQDSGEVVAAKQAMSACRQRYTSTALHMLGGDSSDYENIVPCTPLQQGIISRSLGFDSLLYFNTFRFEIHNVKLKDLRNAFQTAIDRVQILRTVFLETDDGYVQVVKKSLQLAMFDFKASSDKALEEGFRDSMTQWRRSNATHLVAPFEVVIGTAPTGTFMEVHMHHAIYDGNSIEMLLEKVTQICKGEKVDFGKPFIEVLPYGPLRDVSGAKEFWLEHLPTVEEAHIIPLSEEAGIDTLYTGSVEGLGAATIRQSLNVTLQAVVQAAWIVTLRKYYQGAIGIVVSGRSIDYDGAESVIGPLFNTIPFKPAFDKENTWQALVRRCHEFNVAALPFQHTPLRDIMKWCRHRSSEPLFDTLFVFQSLNTSTSVAEFFVEQEEIDFHADYPLSFEAAETKDGKFRITISAQGSICSQSRAAELVEEFGQALSILAETPDAEIGASLGFEFVKNSTTSAIDKQAHQLNGVHDFSWSPEALALRSEIASLACVEEAEVDEHSSIFELGLDSVDAVKLSSRLKRKGLLVTVSALMRSQTIPRILSALKDSELTTPLARKTNSLQELESRVTTCAKSQIPYNDDIERILPASPMQEALISEMIKTSYQAYFNHDVLKIKEDVDIVVLEKAWEAVVTASPILRTGFLAIDDPTLDVTFAQVIKNGSSFHINKIQLPDENFDGYLESTQATFAFETSTIPHFQLTIATTPSGPYLILSIAHALYDGYSLTLLHEDVYDAYHDRFKARPFYGEVLEQALQDTDQGNVSFWRSLLSGASRTNLRPRSGADQSGGMTYRLERSTSLSADDITAFCRKQGVTVQALCQTAWSFVLASYTHSLDVLYGVVQAGRDSHIADQVMFPTMNTVVMRSVLHGSRQEMLQYMQGTIADITEYQHFPLRKIQAACQKQVSWSGVDSSEGLFNTLFTYQKRPGTVANDSIALYESVTGASDVDYPLAVEAEVLDNHLIWRSACKSNVFSEDEAEELLARLGKVIEEIIASPGSPSLHFGEQGVSVCGTSPFHNHDSDADSSHKAPEVEQEDIAQSTWSDQEIAIRNVIAQVTKTPEDEITKSATVQNLGVDSINAIKISSLLRRISMKISVSELIRAGSIAGMMKSLSTEEPEQSSTQVPHGQTIDKFLSRNGLIVDQFGYSVDDVERLLPASAGQIYMLSSWQQTRGHIFFPEFEYVVKGASKFKDVRQAWDSLLKQHDILRTLFCATEKPEMPFIQLVLRKSISSCFDLDNSTDLADAELTQPFARLNVRKIPGGLRLGLKIHHALYDAISLPLLIESLEQHLKSHTAVAKQTGFLEYLSMGVTNETIKKREQFWTKYLLDVPKLTSSTSSAPIDNRRVESFDPSVMAMNNKTEAVLRKQGLSLQALFFAAYAKAYSSLTNKTKENDDKDVVIGIYLANRSHLDSLSILAAPTLNLVPLRVTSPTTTNLIDAAKQIQNDLQTIGTSENSSVGLWEIEQWTGVKIDTFVNFIKLPDEPDSADGNERESEGVYIREADNGRSTEKRSLVHDYDDVGDVDFKQPKELAGNVVQSAYPRSLDVEATVFNGALGIGVFGWGDMIGLEAAEKLIGDVRDSLQEVLDS